MSYKGDLKNFYSFFFQWLINFKLEEQENLQVSLVHFACHYFLSPNAFLDNKSIYN